MRTRGCASCLTAPAAILNNNKGAAGTRHATGGRAADQSTARLQGLCCPHPCPTAAPPGTGVSGGDAPGPPRSVAARDTAAGGLANDGSTSALKVLTRQTPPAPHLVRQLGADVEAARQAHLILILRHARLLDDGVLRDPPAPPGGARMTG